MSAPAAVPRPSDQAPSGGARPRPSALYRTDLWRLGAGLVTRMPGRSAEWISHILAGVYWRCNRRRRETVVCNLLPALANDQAQAKRCSRQLFQNFGEKVVDLWRYESGWPIEGIISDLRGWEHFTAAQRRGRGILLITPHLGNWELGAPLLAGRGIKITVVTLFEPDPALTELRKESRAKWGIETLVVGNDLFAAVEIIRRLEQGATVALLIDRPPQTSAVAVHLFGGSFFASIAAAELARASGCVLLPVYLPKTGRGYSAEVLPEIAYDRAGLGTRGARAELTQRIIGVFEPVIRQYLTQWYHFVPIWPES